MELLINSDDGNINENEFLKGSEVKYKGIKTLCQQLGTGRRFIVKG